MEGLLNGFAVVFFMQLFKALTLASLLNFPGLRQAPPATRVVLAVTVATCTTFVAIEQGRQPPAQPEWLAAIASQVVTGLLAALLWNLILDACAMAVQLASLQSGLSYAAVIDPTNDTESGSLLSIVQMPLVLMLLAAGIHLRFLALLVEAEALATGIFSNGQLLDSLVKVLNFSASSGIRLAGPFIFSMMAVDLLSAISGRLVERFQLSMLVFPLKWVLTLALVWLAAASFQVLESKLAGVALEELRKLLPV
jgi:flagellar biosynthetic protein FliR